MYLPQKQYCCRRFFWWGERVSGRTEGGGEEARVCAYAVAYGALVEVEPVDVVQRCLEDVVDDPQRGAVRGADSASAARSWAA